MCLRNHRLTASRGSQVQMRRGGAYCRSGPISMMRFAGQYRSIPQRAGHCQHTIRQRSDTYEPKCDMDALPTVLYSASYRWEAQRCPVFR